MEVLPERYFYIFVGVKSPLMQYDPKDVCRRVVQIAKRAGNFIAAERKIFTADNIEFKGRQNLVSYVDKNAEHMIVDSLRDVVPGAGFIAEEGTEAGAPITREGLRWIIDPLDGTTNFVHGMPPYCVSIALADEDEITIGVVYEVTGSESYYAWKGSPAYLNGEQIRVSQTARLEDSLVITGLAYNSEEMVTDFMDHFVYFNLNTHGARRLGSAAADLVYVAAGRAEGFYQANLSPWDVAGGAFIVMQAGGVVTDFAGGDDWLFGREIIATNALLYDRFLERLGRNTERAYLG